VVTRESQEEAPTRGNRRSEILEVAAEVFYEKGYPSATLKDIASRLGILRGSMYHYIESKEDLLYELLLSTHLRGITAVEETFATVEGDQAVQLEIFIRKWMQGPGMTPVGVNEHDYRYLSPERRREIIGLRRRIQHPVQKLIAEGVKTGAFRPEVDPYIAASTLFRVFSTTTQWYHPKDPQGFTPVEDWYVLLFLDGLRPPRPDGVGRGPAVNAD
jgi:AcrR family transcriptional regulator